MIHVSLVMAFICCGNSDSNHKSMFARAAHVERLVYVFDVSAKAAFMAANNVEKSILKNLQLGSENSCQSNSMHCEECILDEAVRRVPVEISRQALGEFISQNRGYNLILNEILNSVRHEENWPLDYAYLAGIVFFSKSPYKNMRIISILSDVAKVIPAHPENCRRKRIKFIDFEKDSMVLDLISVMNDYGMYKFLDNGPSQAIWISNMSAPEAMGLMTRRKECYVIITGQQSTKNSIDRVLIHEIFHVYISKFLTTDKEISRLIKKTRYIYENLGILAEIEAIYPNWRIFFEEILVRSMTSIYFLSSSEFKPLPLEEEMTEFIFHFDDIEKNRSAAKFLDLILKRRGNVTSN